MRMLLVDAGHLASRCRHAQASLRTSDGRRSGVVHGFLQSISYVRNHLSMTLDQVWVVWDGGRATWRMDLYPDYKKRPTQELTPDEVQEKDEYISQCIALREGLLHIGVRQIRVEGCEADDIISVLAHSLYPDVSPIIFSGDHDFHQLCGFCDYFHPKDDFLTGKQVLDSYEVAMSGKDILTLKAVRGDKSDNIDGVRGIGEVLAKRVLPYIREAVATGDPTLAFAAAATDKHVASVVADWEKVQRNIKLMRLPDATNVFTPYQAAGLDAALAMDLGASSTMEFARFLQQWELQEHLDHLERW